MQNLIHHSTGRYSRETILPSRIGNLMLSATQSSNSNLYAFAISPMSSQHSYCLTYLKIIGVRLGQTSKGIPRKVAIIAVPLSKCAAFNKAPVPCSLVKLTGMAKSCKLKPAIR